MKLCDEAVRKQFQKQSAEVFSQQENTHLGLPSPGQALSGVLGMKHRVRRCDCWWNRCGELPLDHEGSRKPVLRSGLALPGRRKAGTG